MLAEESDVLLVITPQNVSQVCSDIQTDIKTATFSGFINSSEKNKISYFNIFTYY